MVVAGVQRRVVVILALAFALSACGGVDRGAPHVGQHDPVELDGWTAEVARKACGFSRAAGAIRTEREPILVVGHDWDRAGDDALGYAPFGSTEFESIVFDDSGTAVVDFVMCTSASGSYGRSPFPCPDGNEQWTVQFSAGLYRIEEGVERFEREEWTYVDGSVTCQYDDGLDKGATATSGDFEQLTCKAYACPVNPQTYIEAAGDERAGRCRFSALLEVATGVLDVDGQPVFVVVTAEDRELIDFDGLGPDEPTDDVLCVRVEAGSHLWGLTCGHYPASDRENHTYEVATQELMVEATWVFADDVQTPSAPYSSTHFGYCPSPGTAFVDTRTDISPVQRASNRFTAVVPSVVDAELLSTLGPAAREWNLMSSATSVSETTCAALAQMHAVSQFATESDLDDLGYLSAPLITGQGERAADAFHAMQGSSAVALELSDANTDPVIADWLRGVHQTIETGVRAVLWRGHRIQPLNNEQVTAVVEELSAPRDLDIDPDDATARAFSDALGVDAGFVAILNAIGDADMAVIDAYNAASSWESDEVREHVRDAVTSSPDLLTLAHRARLLAQLHDDVCTS